MFLALLVYSAYISSVDLKIHRITNRSLLFGAITFASLALIQGEPLYWRSALVTLTIAPIALQAKVGGGDIKLATLLSLFFLPSTLLVLTQFSIAFAAISSALVVWSMVKEKSLKSSIALAPAICGAVIWCAR
jgi:Flp pilus assembly protein protease CpaA